MELLLSRRGLDLNEADEPVLCCPYARECIVDPYLHKRDHDKVEEVIKVWKLVFLGLHEPFTFFFKGGGRGLMPARLLAHMCVFADVCYDQPSKKC